VTDRSQSDTQSSATGDAATTTTVAGDAPTKSWLFSQTAGAGTYTERADGTATLTLTDVDDAVTGFTDRPDRDTVLFPSAKLVDAWPTLFATSAPNAVLVVRDASGVASSFVLTLSDPAVDGSTMTYAAKAVQGQDHSSQLPGMTQAPFTTPPATFATVSLFIDNVNPDTAVFSCLNGNGQVISPPGTVPFIYKPLAPYVKLCSDAHGTVSPAPPS
jgi:hypothetical protein